MPIRETTLKKHGEPYLVLTEIEQTVDEALQRLREGKYQANKTYVVIPRSENRYQVILFSELENAAREGFGEMPLSALCIPLADRVVSKDEESGQVLLDWVAVNPQSRVVIVDGSQVIGLFANPNRSAGSGWISTLLASQLFELHGESPPLHGEPFILHGESPPLHPEPFLKKSKSLAKPGRCSGCQHEAYPRFDLDRNIFVCRNCGRELS